MKKLLLIALIAFGAPVYADGKEKCLSLTADLYAFAVAGAPYDLMQKHISDYKDAMLQKEEAMLQFMLTHIYRDIGWTKIDGGQPNRRTLKFISDKTCSEARVVFEWK